MNPTTSQHPTADRLRAFSQGRVSPAELANIQAHLEGCPACCAALGEADDDLFLARLRRAGPSQSSGPATPSLADTVGPARAPATVPGATAAVPSVPGYEVLGELGRGGMGAVYKARHLGLNRLVALKVLLAGAHASPEDLVRFRAEAEAVARLHHPNVVQIYDLGSHAGLPYFALELCEGGTLAEHNRHQPQPPRAAARLVEAVARGVACAHERGLIHRDLKPSNVLLTDCIPKITDFGLAKWLGGETGLTGTGAVVGTPSYMAPEQAAGDNRAVGPAADVYALGAILYELLTGRPPFQAATPLETLQQVVGQEPVPPSQLQPGLPRDLATICLKCLQKEPGRRYASAGALADDLRRFMDGQPIQARPVGLVERGLRWARRNPGWATALLSVFTLLLVIAVGASIGLIRLNALLHRAQTAEADLTDKLFDSYVEKARALRRSQRLGQRFECLDTIGKAVELARRRGLPAERWHELRNEAAAALALLDLRPVHQWPGALDSTIVFDEELKRYLRSHATEGASVRRVSDDAELLRLPDYPETGSTWPWFSPDGRYLSVWQGPAGNIKVWRLDPTEAVLVWDVPAPGQSLPAFAPDSRSLAYALADGTIEFVDLVERTSRRLPPADGARDFPLAPALALHPDGKRFAIATSIGTQSVVQIRDCDTGRVLQTLTGAQNHFFHPVWHPSGHTLAVADDRNVRLWDAASATWIAEMSATSNGGIRLAFSHAGDLLASTDWNGETRFWEPHSGLLVFKTETRLATVQFSSDDRLLAGAVWDERACAGVSPMTGTLRVWEVPRRCYRRLRALPVREGDYRAPTVSLDDRLLAVGAGNGVGLWDLGSLEPVAFLPGVGYDTQGLAFDSGGALWTFGDSGLWRWPVQNRGTATCIGPPAPLSMTPRHQVDPISVDRRGRIVAVRDRTGSWALHVGPPVRRLRLPVRFKDGLPVVSPDGRWIAHSDIPGQKVRILDAGTGKSLRDLPLEGRHDFLGFSPDGHWLWAQDKQDRFHFWRTATWERTPPETGAVHAHPAFTADSRILAIETGEARIRLLDPDTRREFVVLEDPHQDVAATLGMTFSRDGTRLITTSWRATQAIHVWDLRLLREELARMELDWEQTPYPPAGPPAKAPARLVVDRGHLPISPEAGLIAYSLAIVLQPLNPGAYLARASAFIRLGRYPEALADCDRALALAPSYARAWFVRGQVHHHAGSHRQALSAYGLAIHHAPDEVAYRATRLRLASAVGERHLVREDADQLIERQAATPEILNTRAWDLVTGPPEQHDPPRALRLARQAVEQEPDTARHLNTLGVALYRNGRYQEARGVLEKSLEGSKGAWDGFDLFFLAMSHARLGERERAAQCFDQAVRWMKDRKGRLSVSWTEELKAFEAEAAGVLK
jgi:WD40 repeat protein/tetratricopeptide (TPR) repeat protein